MDSLATTRTHARRTTMTRVEGFDEAIDIAVAEDHSCARTATGRVFCWGKIGGASVSSQRPEAIRNLGSIVTLSHGHMHACALAEDGAIWCWGNNEDGQLGDGGAEREARAPVRVQGIPKAASVACGDSHTCALLRSGKVMCWGNNYYGQVGDGSDRNVRTLPVLGPATEAVAEVAGGEYGTCVRHVSGRVSCWGFVQHPPQRGASSLERAAFGLPGMNSAAAIAMHVDPCVIDRTGAVFCWGPDPTGVAPTWIAYVNKDGSLTFKLDALPVSGTLQIRSDESRNGEERRQREAVLRPRRDSRAGHYEPFRTGAARSIGGKGA
jgi:hypothetical protein